VIILTWIILAVAVGMFAHIRRNRSGVGWFLFSLVLSPIAGIIFCAILKEQDDTRIRFGVRRLQADFGREPIFGGGTSTEPVQPRDLWDDQGRPVNPLRSPSGNDYDRRE
jgi:hypothetical protein